MVEGDDKPGDDHSEPAEKPKAQPLIVTPAAAKLPPSMRVDNPNWREVVFDCPWTGHLANEELTIVNKAYPYIAQPCLKCGALIYTKVDESNVVGPDGQRVRRVPVQKH